MPNKRLYDTPNVTIHGTVEALTLSTNSGENLDQDFPEGTSIEIILEGGLS